MQNLFANLPPEALSVRFAYTGSFDISVTRSTHSKVAPSLIVAQAYEGRYGIVRGGVRAETEPGGLFLAVAGDLLTIDHIGDPTTGRMKARWFHGDFRAWETVDLVGMFALPMVVSPAAAGPCGEAIFQMLELDEPRDLGERVRRQALMWDVFAEITALGELRPDAEEQLDLIARLAPVTTYIRLHLAESITIERLAEVARMSPSRLHVVFNQLYQTSPLRYVKQQRIHMAANLLLGSDATISEVAERAGFANPFHFSREFKLIMGVPPSAYRHWGVHEGGDGDARREVA